MTTATPAQLVELRRLSAQYQALSGHPGQPTISNPAETGSDRYTFSNGTVVIGIKKALEYQRALLDEVRDCPHTEVAHFENMDDYCRTCGANLDRAATYHGASALAVAERLRNVPGKVTVEQINEVIWQTIADEARNA